MAHGNYAECPHCGFIAYGDDDIETYFGFRYDGTKPQSWCRSCRSAAQSNSEGLSVDDAAMIWASYGFDEDYMFGYSEDELRAAL